MNEQRFYPMKLSVAPIIMVERPPVRDGTLVVLQLSNESRVYVFPPFFTLTAASWLSRGVSGHQFK
jgi:hypothetical protein